MSRTWLLLLLLTTGVAWADDPAAKKPAGEEAAKRPDGAAPADPAKADPAGKDAETARKASADTSKDDPDLGMSILGNQEAPKSLVIVPWKSSEIGQSLGISTLLDDSRQPIDKEVFMRVLSYYDLMSTTTTKHGRKP